MHRIAYLISLIALSICAVAFTKKRTGSNLYYYYFDYTFGGDHLIHNAPMYTSIDPYNCIGTLLKCEIVATSYRYQWPGTYYPEGTQFVTFKLDL